MKTKKPQNLAYIIIILMLAANFSIINFTSAAHTVVSNDVIFSGYIQDRPPTTPSSVISTELIDYSGFSSSRVTEWTNLLVAQGIPEYTLRIPAFGDWSDGVLSGSWESVSKQLITAADSVGIKVNIDLHTWFTTWDNFFDNDASEYAANRATYLQYIGDALDAFEETSVNAFMVLNEPQAQSASSGENQFILDCISTAKLHTSRPVSVRFMAGYSPTTGHYSEAIDVASDFLCRNTYWDPRNPGRSVYGTTEVKMNTLIDYSNTVGKPLWITEFGSSSSDAEVQRAYVEGFVAYAKSRGIDAVFCWASQFGGTSESYNIFVGTSAKPAFFELVNS